MGILTKLRKLATLRPAKFGVFRYSEPNYLNLRFANGSRISLREWQGLHAYYSSDHLFEPAFASVFSEAVARDPYVSPNDVRLRIFNAVQFSSVALRNPGDVLFCGVSYGIAPFAVAKANASRLDGRKVFLIDAFEGTSSNADRASRGAEYGTDTREIESTFSAMCNLQLVKGYVPGVLSSVSADSIAYAHLNLSDPTSEAAAIDWIAGRLASNGVLLIDAFSMYPPGGAHQYREAVERNRLTAIPLMNGQAVCFKGG